MPYKALYAMSPKPDHFTSPSDVATQGLGEPFITFHPSLRCILTLSIQLLSDRLTRWMLPSLDALPVKKMLYERESALSDQSQ